MRGTRADDPIVSPLGTLADGVVGSGDDHGRLRVDAAGIEIEWWIGADDDWHLAPDGDAHVVRPAIAPAIDARLRVPGGEVVLSGYACATPDGPLVVADLENASPGAVVVAWIVRAAPGYRIGRVALDGTTLRIDERARIELPRAPLRWAVEPRATGVRERVLGGDAASGPFEPVVTRRGDLEIALLFPVAHRTRTRIAAAVASPTVAAVTVATLPSLADVERGWEASIDRGLRVELPEAVLQNAADAARATALLGPTRDRLVADALAAWDLEPGARARRSTRSLSRVDPWPQLRATAERSGASARGAAEWLLAARDALIRLDGDRVDLLLFLPVEWLGLAVAVHDAPSERGPLSFALRWHGARPALLWDVPEGLRVAAPALDSTWTGAGAGGRGEALLPEIDATRLLPLGSTPVVDAGAVIDEPESFS